MEQWKNIPGYENYQVSNLGKIKSLNYKRTRISKLMKIHIHSNGYNYIFLCKRSNYKYYSIHRLVMFVFIGESNGLQVNHKNGIKTDNRLENLEYCTQSENMKHSFRVLKNKHFCSGKFGKDNINAKKLNQYDLKGNLIKKWGSASDVARELGFSRGCISTTCRGEQKTAYGFKWEYPTTKIIE